MSKLQRYEIMDDGDLYMLPHGSLYLCTDIDPVIAAARYFLAEYVDCQEKGRMSIDCDSAATALILLLPPKHNTEVSDE